MATATVQPTEMGGWPPGTRHYRTSEDVNLAVVAGADLTDAARAAVNAFLESRDEELLEELPAGTVIPVAQQANTPAHKVVPQPTVIIECAENGQALNMTPLWSFPAGTTAVDALQQAGFEVAT